VAKIKNVSGEDRIVPGLGGRLVPAGAVVDVDVEDVYAYTCQEPNWAPVDTEAKAAHKDGVKATTEPEANAEGAPEEG
jgi:hypothetical protein